MNGKNLNVRYRKNTYAKTRIKVIAIILGIVAVIALVLFLVIGGILNKKVDNDGENVVVHGTQNQVDTVERVQVASVKGYGVSISGISTTSVSEKATAISKAGGTNMSFLVRDTLGNEIYKSALAQSMGKQGGEDYIDISDIEKRASSKRLSTSAIVPVYSFDKKDDIERAAQLFYDASICVECSREGADDVLVKLEGVEVNDKNIEELLRFAGWVKDLDEKVVIGITLTRDVLEKGNAEMLVGKLWEKYDFLALDLTDMKPGETIAREGKNNEIQFYLLMYKMRVLLPDLATEDLEKIVEEIEYAATRERQIQEENEKLSHILEEISAKEIKKYMYKLFTCKNYNCLYRS